MPAKISTVGMGRLLRGGAGFMHRREVRAALGFAVNFIMGLATSSAGLLGSCGPFGIAMVSAAGGGLGGAFCLAGATTGYIVKGGIDWGVRYVATAFLVYTALFVFQGLKVAASVWFIPLIASALTAVTGFLNSFATLAGIPGVLRMAMELILAGGCSWFFRIALSDEERQTEGAELRHTISVAVLYACALMGIADVEIAGVVSLGRFLSLLAVLALSYRGGAAAGCAVGAVLGLAMDMAGGAGLYFAGSYAFCGLLSGLLSKYGRLMLALVFIICNLAAVLLEWEAGVRVESLYECFAASVIFMLLPSSLLSRVGAAVQSGVGNGEAAFRRYASGRMLRISSAFRDLYETVRSNVDSEKNDNDISRIFDRAADAVCTGCKHKARCWTKEYMDTLSAMNDATVPMMERGRLQRDDLPEHFLEKCVSPDEFISAVNGELRGLMYRRRFRSRLRESRTAAYGQFSEMADILEAAAREISGEGGPDFLAERRLLRHLRALDVDAECSVFRDGHRRLRAVVESGKLASLMRDEDYLNKLSAVLGVRLCQPYPAAAVKEGRMVLLEAEPLTVSVGIAAMKKEGESVSGDRGTYFKTDAGTLCVILSDGMGSGEAAAKESMAAVRLLESFLRAGVEPGAAMRLLNSVVLLKNGEDWGYATVDLMCVDLFTGETSFYKYGAAPSYVKSGKTVRRVRGTSLAAGMLAGEASSPDTVRMRLKPGCTALIASDGVFAEREDAWLRSILSAWTEPDTKSLARAALQAAAEKYGSADDMTVLAVTVGQR